MPMIVLAIGDEGEVLRSVDGYLGECSAAPLPVSGGLEFVSLGAGDRHTCGVTPTGDAYCWGDNYNGELGNPSVPESVTPILVRKP